MNALLTFELRRNRTFFLLMAGLYLLSLAAVRVYAAIWPGVEPPVYMVYNALYIWALPGVLIAEGMFGLASAMLHAGRENSAPEDGMPLPPWKRAYAGLFAGLFYGVLFAALVWGVLVLSPGYGAVRFSILYAVMPLLAVFICTAAYCVAFSFRTAPGGSLALAAFGGLCAAVAAGGLLRAQDAGAAWDFGFTLLAILAASIAGLLCMLALRAGTIALNPPDFRRRNILAAGFAAAGPAIGAVAVLFQLHADSLRLEPLVPNLPPEIAFRARPAIPGGGLLVSSRLGRLAFARTDGSVQELLPMRSGKYISYRYSDDAIIDAVYVPAGYFLAAINNRGEDGKMASYDIWRINPDGERSLLRSISRDGIVFFWGFRFEDGKPALLASAAEDYVYNMMAALPADGGELQWRKLSRADAEARDYADGLLARLAGNGVVSVICGGRERKFVIAGEYDAGEDAPPGHVLAAGEAVAFTVSVKTEGGGSHRLAVCGKAGKCSLHPVETPVLGPRTGFKGYAPESFVSRKTDAVFFAPEGGKLFGPLDIRSVVQTVAGTDGARVTFLKAEGNIAYLLVGSRHLARVDMLGGKLVGATTLPVRGGRGGAAVWCRVEEKGFFLYAAPKLYFVNWDARTLPVRLSRVARTA